MKDFNLNKTSEEINQPSDLFGYVILPEITFDSIYGKLTIGQVLVPDFSSDEKGFTRLKEEFDIFKEFIKEKDILKKGDIAEQLFKNELSWENSNFAIRSSETFSRFVLFLNSKMQAILFETGLSLNFCVCRYFAHENQLSYGAILYNDIPIVQPLSWVGGFYLYCLQYLWNLEEFCPAHHQDLKEKLLDSKLPTHNYLSWAFSLASIDNEYLEFTSEVKKTGY